MCLGAVIVVSSIVASERRSSTAGFDPLSAAREFSRSGGDAALREGDRHFSEERLPRRRWNVLDPVLAARAASIQLVEPNFSLLNFRTQEQWPMASLTKLVTAMVVLDTIGENAKVSVSASAVATEGLVGGLASGEVYRARDLLKIMLMTSSNDAAATFEEQGGGKDSFVEAMRGKLRDLGMEATEVYDASGLDDRNRTTVNDIAKLMRAALAKYPEILVWSRMQQALVQPLNDTTTRAVQNINPYTASTRFLGGKTGTSAVAKENFTGFFSWADQRVLVVLLGAENRVVTTDQLLSWVEEAYDTIP
jgi:D-alanyl-D-alanine endopeptidase (penicillin-binding protein 7)